MEDKILISELLENKSNDGTLYARLLGSMEGLNTIAEFWEQNAKLIHLIATDELIKYLADDYNVFTSDECAAFKAGLGKVGAAMQACWEERQAIIRQSLPPDSKE